MGDRRVLCKYPWDATSIKQLEGQLSVVEAALLKAPIGISLGVSRLAPNNNCCPGCQWKIGPGGHTARMYPSLLSRPPLWVQSFSLHPLSTSDALKYACKETVTKCFCKLHLIRKSLKMYTIHKQVNVKNTAVNYTNSIYITDSPNHNISEVQGSKKCQEKAQSTKPRS